MQKDYLQENNIDTNKNKSSPSPSNKTNSKMSNFQLNNYLNVYKMKKESQRRKNGSNISNLQGGDSTNISDISNTSIANNNIKNLLNINNNHNLFSDKNIDENQSKPNSQLKNSDIKLGFDNSRFKTLEHLINSNANKKKNQNNENNSNENKIKEFSSNENQSESNKNDNNKINVIPKQKNKENLDNNFFSFKKDQTQSSLLYQTGSNNTNKELSGVVFSSENKEINTPFKNFQYLPHAQEKFEYMSNKYIDKIEYNDEDLVNFTESEDNPKKPEANFNLTSNISFNPKNDEIDENLISPDDEGCTLTRSITDQLNVNTIPQESVFSPNNIKNVRDETISLAESYRSSYNALEQIGKIMDKDGKITKKNTDQSVEFNDKIELNISELGEPLNFNKQNLDFEKKGSINFNIINTKFKDNVSSNNSSANFNSLNQISKVMSKPSLLPKVESNTDFLDGRIKLLSNYNNDISEKIKYLKQKLGKIPKIKISLDKIVNLKENLFDKIISFMSNEENTIFYSMNKKLKFKFQEIAFLKAKEVARQFSIKYKKYMKLEKSTIIIESYYRNEEQKYFNRKSMFLKNRFFYKFSFKSKINWKRIIRKKLYY